jgi:hypothetical protein
MEVLIVFALIIVANAFAIIGFHMACQYESEQTVIDGYLCNGVKPESRMVFWRVGYYSDRWLGDFWSKPVYSCPTCMASLHGLLPFLITYYLLGCYDGNVFIMILQYIFYTLSLSGVVTYVNART